MKRIFIEFERSPYLVCVEDDKGRKTYYKQVNIKGPSSIVSVQIKDETNRKLAWVAVEDDVEIEGIDKLRNMPSK